MAELEDKIAGILGNPEAMASILSMAQSLGLGGTPPGEEADQSQPQTEAAADAGGVGDLPFSVSDLLRAAGQMNGRETALLQAIKPFLRPDRQAKLDRAVRAARISHMAGYAIRNLGEKNENG